MKGYKIFNSDFTCRGFKYEEGKTYTHKGAIELCEEGFHFCPQAQYCFNYYHFDPQNIVCEVEAKGKVIKGDDKCVTDKIKIGKRLRWEEVLLVANTGSGNTGHSNSGDWNSGHRNSGDWNSGHRNSGHRNSGDWNSGHSNSGHRNSGDWNSGDRNSGNSNSGHSNSGDWNSGAFCSDQPKLRLFNKESDWTINDFHNSEAYRLLMQVENVLWIPSSSMSKNEKKEHPEHETTGGYLKTISLKEAWENAWGNWDETSRKAFKDLPNFDAKIFEEITGIKVE